MYNLYMIIQPHQFKYPGGTMQYFTAGRGQPLMFLHGGGLTAMTYQKLWLALAKYYQVIAVDLPGFGQSSVPKTLWDFNNYAALIIKLINELKLKRVILVGHSFGGGVGMMAAGQDKRVSKLILLDSAGLPFYYFFPIPKGKPFPYYLLIKYQVDGLLRYQDLQTFSNIIKDMAANAINNRTQAKRIIKIIKKSLLTDYSSSTAVTIPTLLLWGKDDAIFPQGFAELLKTKIKRAQIKYINGDHQWCLYKPLTAAKLINNWLQDTYNTC